MAAFSCLRSSVRSTGWIVDQAQQEIELGVMDEVCRGSVSLEVVHCRGIGWDGDGPQWTGPDACLVALLPVCDPLHYAGGGSQRCFGFGRCWAAGEAGQPE